MHQCQSHSSVFPAGIQRVQQKSRIKHVRYPNDPAEPHGGDVCELNQAIHLQRAIRQPEEQGQGSGQHGANSGRELEAGLHLHHVLAPKSHRQRNDSRVMDAKQQDNQVRIPTKHERDCCLCRRKEGCRRSMSYVTTTAVGGAVFMLFTIHGVLTLAAFGIELSFPLSSKQRTWTTPSSSANLRSQRAASQ